MPQKVHRLRPDQLLDQRRQTGTQAGQRADGNEQGIKQFGTHGGMDQARADRWMETLYILAHSHRLADAEPLMDIQRKRLLYRSRDMGTNENDIFFGSFAEETLASLSKEQLDSFETL